MNYRGVQVSSCLHVELLAHVEGCLSFIWREGNFFAEEDMLFRIPEVAKRWYDCGNGDVVSSPGVLPETGVEFQKNVASPGEGGVVGMAKELSTSFP